MFKIQNWPNRKFSRSVDGNFGKFDPKLDVLGSKERIFGRLIFIRVNMSSHGSVDARR